MTLRIDKEKLEVKIGKVNSDHSKMKRAALFDENVMVGLKKRMETAESELERLKRKRTDSISPERVITGILKRLAASPPSGQLATGKDVPSSSAQPTPKKSRNRKNRWDEIPFSSVPPKPPPTSSNKDGWKGKKEHTSLAKKKDPVLDNSPNSFRRKQDIIEEIKESAKTLGLSRSDTSLVFYRSSVEDHVDK